MEEPGQNAEGQSLIFRLLSTLAKREREPSKANQAELLTVLNQVADCITQLHPEYQESMAQTKEGLQEQAERLNNT